MTFLFLIKGWLTFCVWVCSRFHLHNRWNKTLSFSSNVKCHSIYYARSATLGLVYSLDFLELLHDDRLDAFMWRFQRRGSDYNLLNCGSFKSAITYSILLNKCPSILQLSHHTQRSRIWRLVIKCFVLETLPLILFCSLVAGDSKAQRGWVEVTTRASNRRNSANSLIIGNFFFLAS